MFGWGKLLFMPRYPCRSSRFVGESHDAYNQVYDDNGQPKNEAELSHELVAGGAAFAAFKAFEDRQRKEG